MYSRYFKPFPTLETERLILRKLNKHDAEDLYEYCKSYKSARFSKWQPHESVAVTKSFINYSLNQAKRGEYFTWGIELKSTGKLIGTCSYNNVDNEYKIAEIGYGLTEAYHGNGYAKEAVEKILEYGFCTVGFIRMYAQVVKENISSINLLETIGFECEGLLKNGVYLKGTPADVFIFGITDSAYGVNASEEISEAPQPDESAIAEDADVSNEVETTEAEATDIEETQVDAPEGEEAKSEEMVGEETAEETEEDAEETEEDAENGENC